jgi:prepilin-type N-terminal cleavage/methylation domain-containing protein
MKNKKMMLKKFFVKNKKGFSLIEMMVVVVVMGLIILGLVTFFTGGTRSWITGQFQLSAQRNARQAMDLMVREIRHGEAVTSATTNSITIAIPALGSDPADSVTYSWTGTPGDPINRQGNPLINNVKKLEFTYPDASKVHIVLEVDVDKDSNPDITLNSDINLRNFGL